MYRFVEFSGQSGCSKIVLETQSLGSDIVSKRNLLQISMFGKVPGIDTACVFDIADYMVAEGYLVANRSNPEVSPVYSLTDTGRTLPEGVTLEVMEVRDTSSEDGWTFPDGNPVISAPNFSYYPLPLPTIV
jgi:hypothetical protein